MYRRARDLKGMKQNYLTAIEYAGSNGKKSLWKVRCDCGKEFIMTAGHFLEGKQKSCGCMRGKLIEAAKGTHRHSKHPLYHVWRSMKQRCTVPTAQAWANYGGRGIRVCDRWLESFENFWADMSPTYQEGLTLDRIDVNGDYAPENCRWVDVKTQKKLKIFKLSVGQNYTSGSSRKIWDRKYNFIIQIRSWLDRRYSVHETGLKQQVYDLKNAGPNHRFTIKTEAGPMIVHNCVQGISRDLLLNAMRKVGPDARICMHIHDELVIEAGDELTLDEVCKRMAEIPEWAEGLLLRADGYETKFYLKD